MEIVFPDNETFNAWFSALLAKGLAKEHGPGKHPNTADQRLEFLE